MSLEKCQQGSSLIKAGNRKQDKILTQFKIFIADDLEGSSSSVVIHGSGRESESTLNYSHFETKLPQSPSV